MDQHVAYYKPLFDVSRILQRDREASTDDLYARVACAMSLETFQSVIDRLASFKFIEKCGNIIIWSGPCLS